MVLLYIHISEQAGDKEALEDLSEEVGQTKDAEAVHDLLHRTAHIAWTPGEYASNA